jgi:hypothetical protein
MSDQADKWLAVCITGVASHAQTRSRGAFVSHPLASPQTHAPIAAMLDGLSERHRVHHEVVFVLDPARWAAAAGKSWPHRQVEYGAGTVAWRAAKQAGGWGGRSNLSVMLRDAVAALRPVQLVSYEREPFCRGPRRHVCNCSAPTTTLWWEQQAKNAVCLQEVESRERRRGRQFDFVLKLRSDMQAVPSGVSAAAIAIAMERAAEQPGDLVHVSAWAWGRRRRCYRESDWLALVPRSHAAVYFNFSESASCGFFDCARRRYAEAKTLGDNSGGCMNNERILIEWLIWHNVRVAPLPVANGTRRTMVISERVKAAKAAAWGVVERTTHKHAYEPFTSRSSGDGPECRVTSSNAQGRPDLL